MAVARSDSGTVFVNAGGASTASLTTLTVGSAASLLIAFVHMTVIPATLTLTWDFGGTNQVMTQVATVNNTTVSVTAFTLMNPTTGLRTLHAVSSITGITVLSAIAYSGSDDVTGINLASIVTPTGTGTALSSGPITSPAGGATLAAASAGASINSVAPAQVYRSAGRSLSVAPAGTTTHTGVIISSAAWCMAGFAVLAGSGRPVTAAAGGKQFDGEIQQLGLSGTSVILDASMGVT